MDKSDERTFKFALRIIRLVNALPYNKIGDVLGRQVLRSGTSIGANIEETFGASSRREFTRMMSISQREARETHYWLRLIRDSGLLTAKQIDELVQQVFEIKRIISKAVVTSKESNARGK